MSDRSLGRGYRLALGDFLTRPIEEFIGQLTQAATRRGFGTVEIDQVRAWEQEHLGMMQTVSQMRNSALDCEKWWLLWEYDIPRRNLRPDLIMLACDVIITMEFKVGAQTFDSIAKWQAVSYALDLQDFHAASHGRSVVPVLVATDAPDASCGWAGELYLANSNTLADTLTDIYRSRHTDADAIDASFWENADYRPTPNIIEAAEALYSGHSVVNISHAFAANLTDTSDRIVREIERSQGREHTICFVTGLPGSGKTLAGLNTVHNPVIRREGRPSGVFLSGNGPLVRVIREALARDAVSRGAKKETARREVRTFVHNVHNFINEYMIEKPDGLPYEFVVVFDEAQRAWSEAKVRKEARRKSRGLKKPLSEPEMLLAIMERAPWAVVVALVGGGQEIYDGEAGLAEWGRAIGQRPVEWRVVASPEVFGGESVAGHRLAEHSESFDFIPCSSLHLAESVRSPRAKMIGQWSNALLESRPEVARRCAPEQNEFPVRLVRDLDKARQWLLHHAAVSGRCGLLASSGALRLRPHGLEVTRAFRSGFAYEEWFLADDSDPRASGRLEVAATEFECQGLEVDWACLCWDLDLRRVGNHWGEFNFRGAVWESVRKPEKQVYLRNKYRVLLTRARQGLVIWVPPGDDGDPTRPPALYDAIADFLVTCGLPVL